MSYTLLIRPEAEEDIANARNWYDEQRDGLGDDFLLCVEEALERVCRMPEVHAPVYKGVRRTLIRRFPYVVYYRLAEDVVVVLAVIHGRRDPKHWKDRADQTS